MAITKDLKSLIKHAAEIITLFEIGHSTIYSICPFVDSSEPDSEVVTITITHDAEIGLGWEFLDPFFEYCKVKKIAYNISTRDNKFLIEIRF